MRRLAAIAGILLGTFASVATADIVPITSRELVEVRGLSGLTVSPDGQTAIVRVQHSSVARNDVELLWYVVPLTAGTPATSIATAGEPIWTASGTIVEEQPRWSPDSHWIYYRALHGQEVQIWRTRRDGGITEQVTDDPADIRRFAMDPRRERLFYVVGATREEIKQAEAEEYRNGVVFGASTGLGGRVVNNVPYNGRWATVRRDTRGFLPLLNEQPERVRVVDLATDETHDATESDLAAYKRLSAPLSVASDSRASGVSISPADTRVAFLARTDPSPEPASRTAEEAVVRRIQVTPELQLRWAASVDAKNASACGEPVCKGFAGQLELVGWRPDGQEVLFARFGEDGSTETALYAWNPRQQRVRTVISGGLFSTNRFGVGDCPIVGDHAVCVRSAAASPPRVESIDLGTGKSQLLFDPNAHLRENRFGAVESLHWRNQAGDGFHGYLLMPVSARPVTPAPLIITTYTCDGFLRGGSGDEYPEHVLAAAGFVVLCYNHDVRNTARNLQRDEAGEWRPIPGIKNAVTGLEAAIDLLAARGLVDPSRVAVSGLSWGSRLTLYAISHSRRFAAASSSGGSMLDTWTSYTALLGGSIPTMLRAMEGTPPFWNDPKGILRQISPSLNADKIDAPLLVQVSDAEFGGEKVELAAQMKRAGKILDMVIFPDELHQKMQPAHKRVVYDRNVDWFRFWLQGYEDSDPAKRGQYERWREYREAKRKARTSEVTDDPGHPSLPLPSFAPLRASGRAE